MQSIVILCDRLLQPFEHGADGTQHVNMALAASTRVVALTSLYFGGGLADV